MVKDTEVNGELGIGVRAGERGGKRGDDYMYPLSRGVSPVIKAIFRR